MSLAWATITYHSAFSADSPQGAVFWTTKITRNEARECNLPPPICRCQPYFPSQPKEKNTLLLVLPAGAKVEAALAKNLEDPNEIILNGSIVILYTIYESQNFVLNLTSAGTRYQGVTTHIPKYKLLTLNAPKYTCPKSPLRLEPNPQVWLNGVLRQHCSLLSSSYWANKYLGFFCTQTRPIKHFENRYNMDMTTGTIVWLKSFIYRGSKKPRVHGER